MDWTDRAVCAWAVREGIADPDLWFPERRDHRQAAQAKQWCSVCPVTSECLDMAMSQRRVGVWGGALIGPETLRRLV